MSTWREVQDFFTSMDEFFRGASSPDAAAKALKQAHPGWDAKESRLRIYGRFIDAHVRDSLEKNYPLVRGVVGEERWTQLVRAYFDTGPARHFEMNQLTAGFPAFVADLVVERALPAFVPALARFEWADFETYASIEEIPSASSVSGLTANPTLSVLQHPWRLVPWIRTAADVRPAAPAEADETVLIWRHPITHRTMYLAADDGALLVLKMALENVSESDAAAAGAVSVERIREIVQVHANSGLVLRGR